MMAMIRVSRRVAASAVCDFRFNEIGEFLRFHEGIDAQRASGVS